MLRDVKAYIQRHEQVSAQMIADHFDTDLETVFAWMDHLIRQGQVQRIDAPTCTTGGCHDGGCAATGLGATLYRWLPKAYRPLNIAVKAH